LGFQTIHGTTAHGTLGFQTIHGTTAHGNHRHYTNK